MEDIQAFQNFVRFFAVSIVASLNLLYALDGLVVDLSTNQVYYLIVLIIKLGYLDNIVLWYKLIHMLVTNQRS